MYEILLTRIFSVTMLYHFAFVALSLAMFGMTAGALLVYLVPRWFPPERLHQRLAAAAVALPIGLVLSFMTQLSIPFRVYASVIAVYAMVLTYAVISVPFVLSGVVICLTLTGFPRAVSRLYAADLAGAALGCVLLIFVLDWSDGPTAVLWIALLASGGGVAFAVAAGSTRLKRAAMVTSVVLAAAAAGHTVLVWRGMPVFRILYTKMSAGVRSIAALRQMEFLFARPRDRKSGVAVSAGQAGASARRCQRESGCSSCSSTSTSGRERR